jgi:hypothetical protein
MASVNESDLDPRIPFSDSLLMSLSKLTYLEELTIKTSGPRAFTGPGLIEASKGWSRMRILSIPENDEPLNDREFNTDPSLDIQPILLTNMPLLIKFELSFNAAVPLFTDKVRRMLNATYDRTHTHLRHLHVGRSFENAPKRLARHAVEFIFY